MRYYETETVILTDVETGKLFAYEVPLPTNVPELRELAVFVTLARGYGETISPDTKLPTVRVIDSGHLGDLAGNSLGGISGMLVHDVKEIWLSYQFCRNYGRMAARSILVHELTHYFQSVAVDWNTQALNVSATTIIRQEQEAYRIQEDWNRANGLASVFHGMTDEERDYAIAEHYRPWATQMAASIAQLTKPGASYAPQPEHPDLVQACKIEVPRVKRPLPETPQEHVQRVRRLTGRDGTA